MKTTILGPPLPYIMDLETGISLPRDRPLQPHNAAPASLDAIRRQAYARWESEGHPGDRGLANWLDAETELQPNLRIPVKAIPAVHPETFAGEAGRNSPSETKAREPAFAKAAYDGPSPLCREAIGEDVRDYAFHLYVQSGCAADRLAECWREARQCLDARLPEMGYTRDERMRAPPSALPRFGQ